MHISKEDLHRRNLIFNGRHLPYNPELKEHARYLRNNQTTEERKLWNLFLKRIPEKVLRQRPIDNFIVDFYFPRHQLVIEIDGSQHFTKSGKKYDANRTKILECYEVKVLRFSNREIDDCFDEVCNVIRKALAN